MALASLQAKWFRDCVNAEKTPCLWHQFFAVQSQMNSVRPGFSDDLRRYDGGTQP